jgi:hypothetical protein
VVGQGRSGNSEGPTTKHPQYLNRGRFERGYGNREARMGRPRRDNDLGNIKIKIPSFKVKMILKFIWSGKQKWRWCLIVIVTQR